MAKSTGSAATQVKRPSTETDTEIEKVDNEKLVSLDDPSAHLHLPDDVSELDKDALEALPVQMQYEAIARMLQKRGKSDSKRSEFFDNASNPENYSKMQMKNFLRETAGKQQLKQMQHDLTRRSGGGERIAGDPTRQYLLVKHVGAKDEQELIRAARQDSYPPRCTQTNTTDCEESRAMEEAIRRSLEPANIFPEAASSSSGAVSSAAPSEPMLSSRPEAGALTIGTATRRSLGALKTSSAAACSSVSKYFHDRSAVANSSPNLKRNVSSNLVPSGARLKRRKKLASKGTGLTEEEWREHKAKSSEEMSFILDLTGSDSEVNVSSSEIGQSSVPTCVARIERHESTHGITFQRASGESLSDDEEEWEDAKADDECKDELFQLRKPIRRKGKETLTFFIIRTFRGIYEFSRREFRQRCLGHYIRPVADRSK